MFSQDFEAFAPFGRTRGRGGLNNMVNGFRAKRGMMEPAILNALTTKPMHGYEIISYLEEKTHGIWRPSPGSIYPTLQMLEEKGDVASNERDGKKVYTLTDKGRESAKMSEREEFHEPWGKRATSLHSYQRHFHQEASEIKRFAHIILRKGSDKQKQAMNDAISNLRTRLEQIVEGDF